MTASGSTLRVGFIGAGFTARLHAEAYHQVRGVDVVDLCVPTSLHAPLAIKAARAGKHVIVEKPLTGFFAPASTPMPSDLEDHQPLSRGVHTAA